MTTVKELIAKLQTLPGDLPVIKHERAQSYSFVDFAGVEAYDEDCGEIEVGIHELTDKLIEQGYTDEDLKDNLCVIIG